jgi:hypothetical protein
MHFQAFAAKVAGIVSWQGVAAVTARMKDN